MEMSYISYILGNELFPSLWLLFQAATSTSRLFKQTVFKLCLCPMP